MARTAGRIRALYTPRVTSETRAAVAKATSSSGLLPPILRMSSSLRVSRLNQVVALHQLGIFDRFVDTRDHRLVKPGRHQIDHVHRIGKFLVLLRRHLSRDEDAEVPNALMQAIDDRL